MKYSFIIATILFGTIPAPALTNQTAFTSQILTGERPEVSSCSSGTGELFAIVNSIGIPMEWYLSETEKSAHQTGISQGMIRSNILYRALIFSDAQKIGTIQQLRDDASLINELEETEKRFNRQLNIMYISKVIGAYTTTEKLSLEHMQISDQELETFVKEEQQRVLGEVNEAVEDLSHTVRTKLIESLRSKKRTQRWNALADELLTNSTLIVHSNQLSKIEFPRADSFTENAQSPLLTLNGHDIPRAWYQDYVNKIYLRRREQKNVKQLLLHEFTRHMTLFINGEETLHKQDPEKLTTIQEEQNNYRKKLPAHLEQRLIDLIQHEYFKMIGLTINPSPNTPPQQAERQQEAESLRHAISSHLDVLMQSADITICGQRQPFEKQKHPSIPPRP